MKKMDTAEFRQFVTDHPEAFSGTCRESLEDIAAYERDLGWELPGSLKWLLSVHGYSDSCGVENLEEAVAATLQMRGDLDLPKRILVLNDWGDGGLVLMQTLPGLPEPEVIWTDAGDLYGIMEGNRPSENADVFQSFAMWVLDRYQAMKED